MFAASDSLEQLVVIEAVSFLEFTDALDDCQPVHPPQFPPRKKIITAIDPPLMRLLSNCCPLFRMAGRAVFPGVNW